jgi:hypothetical protein
MLHKEVNSVKPFISRMQVDSFRTHVREFANTHVCMYVYICVCVCVSVNLITSFQEQKFIGTFQFG